MNIICFLRIFGRFYDVFTETVKTAYSSAFFEVLGFVFFFNGACSGISVLKFKEKESIFFVTFRSTKTKLQRVV